MVFRPRNSSRNVGEYQIIPAVQGKQSISSREIDPCFPFGRADLLPDTLRGGVHGTSLAPMRDRANCRAPKNAKTVAKFTLKKPLIPPINEALTHESRPLDLFLLLTTLCHNPISHRLTNQTTNPSLQTPTHRAMRAAAQCISWVRWLPSYPVGRWICHAFRTW